MLAVVVLNDSNVPSLGLFALAGAFVGCTGAADWIAAKVAQRQTNLVFWRTTAPSEKAADVHALKQGVQYIHVYLCRIKDADLRGTARRSGGVRRNRPMPVLRRRSNRATSSTKWVDRMKYCRLFQIPKLS